MAVPAALRESHPVWLMITWCTAASPKGTDATRSNAAPRARERTNRHGLAALSIATEQVTVVSVTSTVTSRVTQVAAAAGSLSSQDRRAFTLTRYSSHSVVSSSYANSRRHRCHCWRGMGSRHHRRISTPGETSEPSIRHPYSVGGVHNSRASLNAASDSSIVFDNFNNTANGQDELSSIGHSRNHGSSQSAFVKEEKHTRYTGHHMSSDVPCYRKRGICIQSRGRKPRHLRYRGSVPS
ncbi:t16.1 [Tupaiid betaherpesvirus 1]|uniref:T16.1 n=1 Tax=Tupaiid herpesvirus 1 (strain 1) TaxID=10397 RepID=Q91TU5_TUHV1|nr:t16.1 [Tupaiid betaherpesvirus 1]AAK57042.1 t16.1 [Tupaiid betaherpesvirus 1]